MTGTRDRTAVGSPHARSGKIARIVLAKQDVRHHSVAPLALEQHLDFLPGPVLVEFRKPQGDKDGIPVPLVRIKTLRRDRVPALVVFGQDGLCRLV